MNSLNDLHEFAILMLGLALGVAATYAVALDFASMSGLTR